MKIIIHYPFIARYRLPIFQLLAVNNTYDFEFWASKKIDDKFLLTSTDDLKVKNTNIYFIQIPFVKQKFEWQSRAIKFILKETMDAYIVLGNPNSLSTWLCVLIARMRKIPVIMWSHGYLKQDKLFKGFLRKLFYQLANSHLLYGDKAKAIMLEKGFDSSSLHVIYNSLDYDKQKHYREQLSLLDRINTRVKFKFKEDSLVLIAMGRLMKKLNLEQVIKAIKMKSDEDQDVRLIIVGDGPEKHTLKKLTNNLNINDKILFYGACHDECLLANLYNASDYSVVMGKVGLSAMHSLAYGIPMITNNNFNEHFPEIEAVIDNKTGFYFQEGDINDFLSKLKPLLYRGDIYRNCINVIEERYTPEMQETLIENALYNILN